MAVWNRKTDFSNPNWFPPLYLNHVLPCPQARKQLENNAEECKTVHIGCVFPVALDLQWQGYFRRADNLAKKSAWQNHKKSSACTTH